MGQWDQDKMVVTYVCVCVCECSLFLRVLSCVSACTLSVPLLSSFAFRENLLARQTLEQNIIHTGATDLDVAMFHRDGGKHTHTHSGWNEQTWVTPPNLLLSICLSVFLVFPLSLSSQVRTRIQTQIFRWRRSTVFPSLPLRARTTSASVGVSSDGSSAPITVSVCSPSPPTTTPKVDDPP